MLIQYHNCPVTVNCGLPASTAESVRLLEHLDSMRIIMEKPITDFILKSHIRQLIRNHHGSDITSIDRNKIIGRLWDWIYTPHRLEGYEDPFDTAHLLELLKKESERVEVEENGVVRFTSVKFYLTDQNSRLSITAANPPTSVSFGKSRSPEETAAYMSAFNDAMPDIHRYIEEEIATIARDKLLSDITAATAKGMLESIISEEGLEVPKISCIRGTEKGRVILYFDEIDEKINCPLDYLRSRLIRRFANKRRK